MAKKINNKMKLQQVGEETVSRKKRFMKMGVGIFLAAIVLFSLIFFISKGGVGVGKAVQITEQGQAVVVETGQSAKLSIGQAYAAINDQFTVSLIVDTNGQDVGQVNFQLDHPNFELLSQSAQSSLSTITAATNNDPVWSFWSAEDKVNGQATVASFTFRLTDGNKNDGHSITFSNIELVVNPQTKFGPLVAVSTITVADGCTDVDNDGWGAPNTDLRACPQSGLLDCSLVGNQDNVECGSGKRDCDDDEATMYPGNNEDCNGLDNNCNGLVDEGVSGSKNNAPNVGVCMGKQLCIQGDEHNSYNIAEDATVEIDGNQENLRGYIKSNPDLAQHAKFKIGPGDNDFVWSFEAYGEDICDTVDNNCNGVVNEDSNGPCLIGGGGGVAGLPYGQGEILLDWEEGNVAGAVDQKDLHALDLLTERNDVVNLDVNTPNCGLFQTGYVCTCPNGNYFLADALGQNVELVNYLDGTKSDVVGASVDIDDFEFFGSTCNPQ